MSATMENWKHLEEACLQSRQVLLIMPLPGTCLLSGVPWSVYFAWTKLNCLQPWLRATVHVQQTSRRPDVLQPGPCAHDHEHRHVHLPLSHGHCPERGEPGH